MNETKPKVDFRTWLLNTGSWVLTFGAALAGVVIASFAIDAHSAWNASQAVAELSGAVGIAAGIVGKEERRKGDSAGKRRNLKYRLEKMLYAGIAARVISTGLAAIWAMARPILHTWGLPV